MKNNKLVPANESGFIMKIKQFFDNLKLKIFCNSKIDKEKFDNEKEEIIDNQDKENFIKELNDIYDKKDNTIERKGFLEKIKGNRELLNMLSIDRLKMLDEYYDDIILQNEKKIDSLKKKI